jgi:hypothetical protein
MDHTNASGAKTTMKIRTDKILTKCADHALKTACFGRNGAHTTHDLVLAETLATSMATSEAGSGAKKFIDRIRAPGRRSICSDRDQRGFG